MENKTEMNESSAVVENKPKYNYIELADKLHH